VPRAHRRQTISSPIQAFGVLLLSVIAGLSYAADPPPSSVHSLVNKELEKRKAIFEEAVQLVQEGDLLQENGEVGAASTNYRRAVDLLPESPQARQLRYQAVQRFADSSVAWADELIAAARFDQAEAVIDIVLSPEYLPTHDGAIELKEQLQDSDYHNRALTPEHLEKLDRVKKLLLRARGFARLGRHEDASLSYAEVLKLDPFNTAARRGMETAARQVSHSLKSSRDHTRARLLREVDEEWKTQSKPNQDLSGLFGVSEASTPGGLRLASLSEKLRSLIIPRVEFIEANLTEVVEFLTAQSQRLDPAGGGVNIVLDDGGQGTNLNQRRVSVNLSTVPLGDVLRYVTELSSTRYRVDEYAVRILPRSAGQQESLRTVTFRVPPTFISSGEVSGEGDDAPFSPDGPGAGGGLTLTRLSAQEFLTRSGVNFPEGAAATFVAATSSLILTNTEENIDFVQQLVDDALSASSQQVKVQVVILETNVNTLKEFGYDWLLGQFNVPGSDRVFGAGGTVGNQQVSNTALNGGDFPFVPPGADVPVGAFPVTAGNRGIGQIAQGDSIDSVLIAASNNDGVSGVTPGVLGLSGVLTDPQFQVILRTLNQSENVDFSISPTIVTRSGQRASVRVVREFPYPTEFEPPEIPQDSGNDDIVIGGFGGFGQQPSRVNAFVPATPTAFNIRELGASIDVEAIISPDKKTITLNIVPEFDQFEGFIDYGNPVLQGEEVVAENNIIQPVFRKITTNVDVDIWDGNAVVIGGLLAQESTTSNDRTPVIGSLPIVGKLFRKQTSSVQTKAVLIMASVNILDPTGEPLVRR